VVTYLIELYLLGGGYISFEFAHIATRSGSNVTILHRGKQPLEHFDPDLVNRLVCELSYSSDSELFHQP
jgi:glutathione reductase (NADPH)